MRIFLTIIGVIILSIPAVIRICQSIDSAEISYKEARQTRTRDGKGAYIIYIITMIFILIRNIFVVYAEIIIDTVKKLCKLFSYIPAVLLILLIIYRHEIASYDYIAMLSSMELKQKFFLDISDIILRIYSMIMSIYIIVKIVAYGLYLQNDRYEVVTMTKIQRIIINDRNELDVGYKEVKRFTIFGIIA